MKRSIRFLNKAIFIMLAAAVMPAGAQEKKRLSFEQIFKDAEPKIISELPRITGWADDGHYIESIKNKGDEKAKLYAVNARNGKKRLYRDLDRYRNLADSAFNLDAPVANNDAYDMLIYLKDNDLYLLNTQKKEFKRLTQNPSEEKNPTMSPDGKHVAFTRDNNLFAVDLRTGVEYQYTNDGTDVVYNGRAAWIYYEEIFGRPSRYRAFWWSPDGRFIAFYRFDETNVPLFPLYDSDGIHGSLENTRYPKAGDPNPDVKIGVVAVSGGTAVWADFNEKDDQYFGTPFWTPDGKELFVQWMNRGQDTLKIYSVDPEKGTKKEIFLEYQTSWVDWFTNFNFLKNNSGFIVERDKSGWNHLYLYSRDGKMKNAVTSGNWSVSEVKVVDEDKDLIYFTARKEATVNTDLYSVKLDGTGMKRMTSGAYTHSALLSPKGSYFIDTYSNISAPPEMALYDNTGKLIRYLGDSRGKEFSDYELASSEIFGVRTSDGYELPVSWMLPLNLDEKKKYPVLIEIYGGPASYDVSNRWPGLRPQWLAMEGIIQMAIDHRGSVHFGKTGTSLMHRNLGKWEMNDYIEVVKWLRTKPFVDSTKICISGESYGGYAACMALTYGADYFTHGLAGYSVTDFRLYDSHYTERFMDTPAENPEGYKNASAMTFAEKYKGILFMYHGTMDDNVHMQNIIQLAAKLQDNKKHFELMLYPGGRHGWGGPKATHLRNERYRFYYSHLLGKEFPETLFK